MLLALALAILSPVQAPATDAPVLSDTLHRLPNLGLEVHDRRVLDRDSGRVRRVTTFADGTPADWRALRERERRLSLENGGRVSPALRREMQAGPLTDLIDVVFWLKCDDSPDFRSILIAAEESGMDGERARRLARDTAREFFAARIAGFSERLAESGIEVTRTGGAWPIVFARVPNFGIEDWARDPAVDKAYHPSPRWEAELVNAQGTMRTFNVWARGVTGASSPVKVLVNDTGHVSTSNPDLPPIVWLNTGLTGSHGTGVAGNIAFDHPTYKGSAFGLPQLYSSAGTGDVDAPVIWDDAITQGISLGNCSWWNFQKGAIEFLDRFFDYTLRNFAVMMFKSNGNQGGTSEPYATTPGNAYNVTCTGAYSDSDDVDWADDFMASYSSYWNPAEGHEKPELANAGDNVITAGTTTTQLFNGTSSASPLTCGVATLLATRNPALMTKPEALKAILMVSAWHNVEGAAVLSDRDGAGAVHALAADSVVRDEQFVHGALTPGDFTSGQYDVPFEAYEGDETRVIALWFSKANSGHTLDMLQMDLDLVVLDPENQPVAFSASALSPFEIASFVPGQTGTYTIRLTNQRFEGNSEPFCVAWSSRQDAAVGRIGIIGTPRVGASVTLGLLNEYDASVSYVLRGSAGTLPDVYPVGDGQVLGLRQDRAFAFSVAQPGFTGSLNASGTALAPVTLPNKPGLVGRTFYLGFWTHSGGAILDTSELASLTVEP